MESADMNWRKSTRSNRGGNACVEVASSRVILVRDTTQRSAGTLTFTAEAWEKFTASIK